MGKRSEIAAGQIGFSFQRQRPSELYHIGGCPAFSIFFQCDVIGGQIFLCRSGNPPAFWGESALVAGTFDILVILLIVDSAAKVGTSAGDSCRALHGCKEDEIVTGVDTA